MIETNERIIAPPRARSGRARMRRGMVRVLVGLGLIAAGAFGAGLVFHFTGNQRGGDGALGRPRAVEAPLKEVAPASVPTVTAPAEVEVVVSPEALARAGIKTSKVTTIESNTSIRVPGVVMANSYREVRVTPIVGGIVTRVHVELGTAVKRGAPLATLFSNELADAQTRYLSLMAMLEADQKKFQRVKQLVEIGAASRQELEEVTAVRASRVTEVEAARQRLLVLGLTREEVEGLRSPSQVIARVVVPAPIDGVITGRSANLGQVVGMGQELFVVTDLSDVWVVGDLYEQDFEAVRLGSEATLTTPAYPGLRLQGRVSYIDPRVDSQTRTTKVRVAIPNPEGRLRLGMYMTMSFTTRSGEPVVVVPRSAVQTIGDRHVVFVPVKDEEGKFIQRAVRVGRLVGESYTVLSGLQPGEVVVMEGSFLLRAESLRSLSSG